MTLSYASTKSQSCVPTTDLPLHNYKTTTTCPQKQTEMNNTQKSTKRSYERPQTSKAYHWQRVEVKVLFRQIPGIPTVLGKQL